MLVAIVELLLVSVFILISAAACVQKMLKNVSKLTLAILTHRLPVVYKMIKKRKSWILRLRESHGQILEKKKKHILN